MVSYASMVRNFGSKDNKRIVFFVIFVTRDTEKVKILAKGNVAVAKRP